MMATEQPVAHMEEPQHVDEGEMGEGEEEVSRRKNNNEECHRLIRWPAVGTRI